MSLEVLVKPVKWLDEQILRQYSKLTEKCGGGARSKYILATVLSAPTWVTMCGTYEVVYTIGINAFTRGYDTVQNVIGLIRGEHLKGVKETGDGLQITSKELFNMERFMKVIRMPMFLFGSSFMVKGGVNLFNYLTSDDQSSLASAIQDFQLGFSSLGLASSIYIKNNDPKILDKEPAWKTAYNWLREKASSLSPEPVPQPVPIQVDSTLENYVHVK